MIDNTKQIKQCASCNGACCIAFCLRYSKRDMFKRLFSKYAGDKADRFNYIKGLLILKSLDKTPYGQDIKKRNHLGSQDFLYSCRLLSKFGGCLIYKLRPTFCKSYDCHGITQFAHADTKKKLGIPRLNASQKRLLAERLELKEVFIDDLKNFIDDVNLDKKQEEVTECISEQ